MFCPECGVKLEKSTKFCENCGARLIEKEETPPVLTEPEVRENPPVLTEPEARENPPARPEPVRSEMPREESQIEETEEFVETTVGTSENKKSKTPIIVAVIAVVVALAAIAVVVVLLIKDKSKEGEGEQINAEVTDSDVYSDTGIDEEIAAVFDLELESKEDYDAYFDRLEEITLYKPEEYASDDKEDVDYDEEDEYEPEPDEDVISEDENSGDDSESIAASLSTSDYAKAMDFEWLVDIKSFDGTSAGHVIDDSHAKAITSDVKLLNGGWKAYLHNPDDGTERYLNAEIDVDGDSFTITFNWKYFFDGNASYDELGSDVYTGEWNSDKGTVETKTGSGKVTFDAFYISNDNSHEYAYGEFVWPSGEKDYVGLMR